MATRQSKERMLCPECGSEMNQHALKLADPRDANDELLADPDLGAVVTEAHTCPACGANAARRR